MLGDRAATADDYGRLPYATQVFSETLRLYPPVWVMARTCVQTLRDCGLCYSARERFLWRRSSSFIEMRVSILIRCALTLNDLLGKKDSAKARPRFAFFPFRRGQSPVHWRRAGLDGRCSVACYDRSGLAADCLASEPGGRLRSILRSVSDRSMGFRLLWNGGLVWLLVR